MPEINTGVYPVLGVAHGDPPMTPGGREATSISRDAIKAGYQAACEL